MKIPVRKDKMVTEVEKIDETIPYNVICRDCKVADHRDVHEDRFLGMRFEVIEPEEWKGKIIMANYVPMAEPPEGGDRAAWRRFEETNEQFMRFLESFKVPVDDEGFDPRDAIGLTGQVTATSEKFNGRTMTRVADFLL